MISFPMNSYGNLPRRQGRQHSDLEGRTNRIILVEYLESYIRYGIGPFYVSKQVYTGSKVSEYR